MSNAIVERQWSNHISKVKSLLHSRRTFVISWSIFIYYSYIRAPIKRKRTENPKALEGTSVFNLYTRNDTIPKESLLDHSRYSFSFITWLSQLIKSVSSDGLVLASVFSFWTSFQTGSVLSCCQHRSSLITAVPMQFVQKRGQRYANIVLGWEVVILIDVILIEIRSVSSRNEDEPNVGDFREKLSGMSEWRNRKCTMPSRRPLGWIENHLHQKWNTVMYGLPCHMWMCWRFCTTRTYDKRKKTRRQRNRSYLLYYVSFWTVSPIATELDTELSIDSDLEIIKLSAVIV